MTKVRTPLSFERGLVRIADLLGWARMGELIGKAARTVQDYSDEDTSTGICLADAYTLEEAYRLAGGEGAPISDYWRQRLDQAERGASGRDQLAQLTMIVAKESGEALAALIAAQQPGASPAIIAIAKREVQESIDAKLTTLAHLNDGAGPDVGDERGDPGGSHQ